MVHIIIIIRMRIITLFIPHKNIIILYSFAEFDVTGQQSFLTVTIHQVQPNSQNDGFFFIELYRNCFTCV